MSHDFTPELLSLYDPVYLEHQQHHIDGLLELRNEWSDNLPTAVELGSHRASFLIGQAKLYAPRPVLGLEWRGKYHRIAEKRRPTKELDNLWLVQADAKLAVPILFPPESVEAFFVTFPDPWWKKRHRSRRLLDPVFLRVIARRLVPGGRLYLKSDVFDYLYRVRAMIDVTQAFRPLPAERWPDESGWTWTTRERKCMNAGIPFGRGYYERLVNFDARLPSKPEDGADFPFVENVDPVSIIRGMPPADIEAQAQQRAALEAEADRDE